MIKKYNNCLVFLNKSISSKPLIYVSKIIYNNKNISIRNINEMVSAGILSSPTEERTFMLAKAFINGYFENKR